MKKSFLRKLMVGTISIISFVFLLQLLFQRLVLPTYFLAKVKDNIETEISEIPDTISQYNLSTFLVQFASETSTTNTTVNINELQQTDAPVQTIEITNNAGSYLVMMPRMDGMELALDDSISATLIETDTDVYLPVTMSIEGVTVYGSTSHMGGGMRKTPFLDRYQDAETIQVAGTISAVSEESELASEKLNVSTELVNLLSGNITSMQEYENGLSYISVDQTDNPVNLVYATEINVDGTPEVLLTVYPLASIYTFARDITEFGLFTYVALLLVLIIFFYFYLRRISVPLQQINATAKDIANLNFTTVDEIHTEDEIGQLSKSINIMSSNLQNALSTLEQQNESLSQSLTHEMSRDQMRQDFVAGISHELKTPLAVIQATNEAMEQGIFPQEEFQKHYDTIKQEIERSNKIIQDMIHVYNFDQTEYKEQFMVQNMKDTVLESIHQFEPLINAKEITFSASLDDLNWTYDHDKILLVINNFLSNAVKYTNEKGEIQITLQKDEFRIFNSGSSIPENDISHLFEPFFRVDTSRSRKDGSTGLGLYVVKQILDQHEAKYGVNNKENGVEFYIKFQD